MECYIYGVAYGQNLQASRKCGAQVRPNKTITDRAAVSVGLAQARPNNPFDQHPCLPWTRKRAVIMKTIESRSPVTKSNVLILHKLLVIRGELRTRYLGSFFGRRC